MKKYKMNGQKSLNLDDLTKSKTEEAKKSCEFKAGNCLMLMHERKIELQKPVYPKTHSLNH